MGSGDVDSFGTGGCAAGLRVCPVPACPKGSCGCPYEKAGRNGAAAEKSAATPEHRCAYEPDLHKLCQWTAYRGCHYRGTLPFGNADSGNSLCRRGFRVRCRYRAGPNLWRVAWRRPWRASDPACEPRQSGVVCYLPADFTAGGGQSDLSKGCGEVRWPPRLACADGRHGRRRGIRDTGNAFRRPGLRGAV